MSARFMNRSLSQINKKSDLPLAQSWDYLFLVDSDLYLDPHTLRHLLSLKKDIVSEVYWTRWKPELIPLPQVWIKDQYTLYESSREEPLCEEEMNKRTQEFIDLLSRPGTYKVGGLGACTLISRKALERGVSFGEIYNLGFTGEDRHFCVRAASLGLELYANTHCPPFHIYRESELDKLQEYKENLTCAKPSVTLGKITLAMLVRNESDRHLEIVLKQATEYIDHAVILDDASEDNTVELCKKILNGIPLTLLSNKNPLFHNEISLRKQLWEMALSTNPEWIIFWTQMNYSKRLLQNS